MDENLHAIAGAALFKTLKTELKLTKKEEQALHEKVVKLAEVVCEHEKQIATLIFEKGKIDGITEKQLCHFVESRVNVCLNELGYKSLYHITYNPIASVFYDGINNFISNDFFAGIGNQYVRGWDANSFVWENEENEENE